MKLLTLGLLASVAAFANSNAASKWFVCATPQNTTLTQGDFEALVWTEIKYIGNVGETGKTTNVLTYDTWGDDVSQKAKGLTDAGSPEVECARDPFDAGQNILEAAGEVGNNNNFAFKEVRADGQNGGTGTIRYHRGLVMGPRYPGGRNEDFDLQVFTLGLQQKTISVKPTTAGLGPTLTAIPAITGTAKVGQVLTVSNGTFTGDATITYEYRWFVGGVAVADAFQSTFTPQTQHIGKIVTARVIARNASGSATGFADPTSAVVA